MKILTNKSLERMFTLVPSIKVTNNVPKTRSREIIIVIISPSFRRHCVYISELHLTYLVLSYQGFQQQYY